MNTERKIIQHCEELINHNGYRAFTMDQLAKQAGISKRTIYKYFKNKDHLLEATLETMFQDIATEVRQFQAEQLAPEELWYNLCHFFLKRSTNIGSLNGLADLRQYYPHLWNKIDEFRINLFVQILDYVKAQNKNSILNHIDPKISTAAMLACIQAILNPHFILSNDLTLQETGRQLFLLFNCWFKDLEDEIIFSL